MPREIKTTLAVDGEAAFKRAINEANTSIRNMGTQLTLATAQFKKDGDAMKLMESRSKTLKSEIEQQSEIVKALEKAVTDSTKAYGENSDKTEKWEAELNRAKARLVNLQSELTLNNAGLDRNGKAFDDSSEKAADYQATLQTIGKGVSFENISTGISKITGGFESAITKVFNFAKAMRDTMVDAGHWADDLMTDATKYNMDVEELQRWRNAADFIDTDVETIVSARDRLSRKMSEGWTQGSGKEKKDMWELLGIDLHDGETGKMRNQMDVMFELGETLRSMVAIDGNDVRASELAMEVFGKSYRDLLPLFNAGQAEWERTVAEQRVVSKEHVEALGAMDDANNQLGNSWETLKYTALAEIAPVMTDAANALSGMLNEFNDWMETEEGKEAMQGLAEALRELFSGLGDIKFKDAIETAKNALNDLKKALEWINEHKGDVENALKIIAGGFALLKVSELAINIGKIVSGFQTLWTGANNPLPSLPGADNTPVTPAGGNTTGGNGGGILATIANALRTPAAKIAGGTTAFLGTFLENAITPQGNDDIFDADGNLRKEMEELGYYIDEDGKVKNRNVGPVYLELGPEEVAKNKPSTLEELGVIDPTRNPEEWAALMSKKTAAENNRAIEGLGVIDPALTPEKWAALMGGKTIEEVTEDVDLDPVYTLAQKLEAAEDWWDAYRNADSGADTYDEEERAFEHLQEALGDGFGDFWDAFLEKSDSTDMSKMEDLPDSITDVIGKNAEKLDEAVSQMKTNTESGKTVADKVSGADFKKFNGLPAEIQAAAQRGTAAGASGIIVRMDGAAVGRLVAPYVNAYLGSAMG